VTGWRVAIGESERLDRTKQVCVGMRKGPRGQLVRLLEAADRRKGHGDEDHGCRGEDAGLGGVGRPPIADECAQLLELADREERVREHEAGEPLRWGIRPALKAVDRCPERLHGVRVIALAPRELALQGADRRQRSGVGRKEREPAPHQAT
jgi:hypothetical protein